MIRSITRPVLSLVVTVVGVFGLLAFSRSESSIDIGGIGGELIKRAVASFLWLMLGWFALASTTRLLVEISLLPTSSASRLTRGLLWISAPLIVHTSVQGPSQIRQDVLVVAQVATPQQSSMQNAVAGTIGVAAARALIEILESKRRHELRTKSFHGYAVVPDITQIAIEHQWRSLANRPTNELDPEPIGEETRSKAENLGTIKIRRSEEQFDQKEKPDATFLIRLMGPIEVVDMTGNRVNFNRAKAMELLAWITEHRDAPRRSLARTAMWDSGVQDSTFNNIVSEARRALNAASDRDDAWISRSYNDHLVLSTEVVSDAELLRNALHRFRRDGSQQNHQELRRAIDLVRGLPFSASGYLWPDSEGLTTGILIAILEAAESLASVALEQRDISEVFSITSKGLSVVPGHEKLVGLRMRAHAVQRSSAGIEAEWRSYLRAVAADSWSGGRPNSDLVELRRLLM